MDQVPSEADNMAESFAEHPTDILAVLRGHYDDLKVKQDEVRKVSTTIRKEKDMTSAQCSRAIAPLYSVDGSVKDFHTLLQSQVDPPLPAILIEKRHTLLVVLNNIENLIDEFQTLSVEEINTQREDALERLKSVEDALKKLGEMIIAAYEQHDDIQTPPSNIEIGSQNTNQRSPIFVASMHQIGQWMAMFVKKIFMPDIKTSVQKSAVPLSNTGDDQRLSPTRASTSQLSHPPADFDTLYNILEKYASPLDLKEICRIVRVDYNRLEGNGHAEKAFALTRQLENEDRLVDLEEELRQRFPRRFKSK